MDERAKRLLTSLDTAFGKDISYYLKKDNVVEIMLNPDGTVWVDKLGEGMSDTGLKLPTSEGRRIIELIAGATGTEVHQDEPILSAELPGTGSRFQGFLPTVVEEPTFTIRKKAIMIFTLNDYVNQGIMTEEQKKAIIKAVWDKENILVVGGTGTGKTTLSNAILAEIAKTDDRIVVLEDTKELQCAAKNKVFLRSNDKNDMTKLLKGTMRLRPDRICVGEVRDGAALALLKAWNTGHPGGLCTLHANSEYAGLIRLEQLIQEVIPTPQRELIAEAVNMIIFIKRHNHGRKIEKIVRVTGLENNKYILKNIL